MLIRNQSQEVLKGFPRADVPAPLERHSERSVQSTCYGRLWLSICSIVRLLSLIGAECLPLLVVIVVDKGGRSVFQTLVPRQDSHPNNDRSHPFVYLPKCLSTVQSLSNDEADGNGRCGFWTTELQPAMSAGVRLRKPMFCPYARVSTS